MLLYITFKLITALIIIESTCASRISNSIQKQVAYIKTRNSRLYGHMNGSVDRRVLNMDILVYPRGDKQKLATISRLWSDHYECQLRQSMHLTYARRLPSEIVMVYQGTVARLPCRLCVAPGEQQELQWAYTESIRSLNFSRIEEKDRVVKEGDGNITIYHATIEDAGVYRCTIGDSVGGVVVLEVVDTDNYTVVKPPTSHGPYPSPPSAIAGELTAFTSWSEWSGCSVCGKVGRRRRIGICYISLDKKKSKESNNEGIIHKDTLKTFEDFPKGIPCRSKYMPLAIRSARAVQMRPNEIMIGMCKVPCKTTIFQVQSRDGSILERTNNSGGVFSFLQYLPPQPPLPVRDVIFATVGEAVVIRCPGTTLRDDPVSWRIGTKYVVPKELDRSSNGRVHVNARDHILISAVNYDDGNLYSCWQSGNLAGAVRLVVWESARTHWGRRATLVVAALQATAIIRIYLPTVLALRT